MGRRYRHLCPYGSPGYLHSSFRRWTGLVSPATSADSATLARVDEFLNGFSSQLRRTPCLRSSVCPITLILRANPVEAIIGVGTISVLCMTGYEPSILYIRQPAV